MNRHRHNAPTEVATYVASGAPPQLVSAAETLSYEIVGEKYRLLRQIGSGGMGEVFLAEHVAIGKRVAVKFLKPDLASDPNHAARFIQEARAASSIRHEHVVDITDYGHAPDGLPFFVMELLEGESLRDLMNREGRLSWAQASALILQVLDGLSAAHAKGITHRDIKPENCFCVARPGRPPHIKLLDFSIAKLKGAEAQSLTATGAPMGTVHYMSPEQARGERGIELRTDIYSCGVMLYEMLAAEVPFDAENIYGILYKIVNQDFPSFQVNSVDEPIRLAIADVLRKAVAKDRDQRYASAAEFQTAIENVRVGRTGNYGTIGHATTVLSLPSAPTPSSGSPRRHRTPLLIAAAGGLGAVASLAYVVLRGPEVPPEPKTEPPTVRSPAQAIPTPSTMPPPVIMSGSSVAPTEAPPTTNPQTSTPPDQKVAETKADLLAPVVKSARADQRSRAVIELGLKSIRHAVDACGQSYALGDTVDVLFEIAPHGSVTSSAAKAPHQSSPLGNCLATAVRKAKFSASRKPQKVTHRFSF